MLTRLRAAVPILAVALTLFMVAAPLVQAIPPYNLTISPSVPVSLGSTITMTLSISGGTRNTAYAVTFAVVKPNGTGSATANRIINTDNRGNGAVTQFYPDPSFTAVSGTVATDVGGVYNVYVNQTSPTIIGNVATGTFTVSSKLNVVVTQPVSGTILQRGQTTTISATVSALSGPTMRQVYTRILLRVEGFCSPRLAQACIVSTTWSRARTPPARGHWLYKQTIRSETRE